MQNDFLSLFSRSGSCSRHVLHPCIEFSWFHLIVLAAIECCRICRQPYCVIWCFFFFNIIISVWCRDLNIEFIPFHILCKRPTFIWSNDLLEYEESARRKHASFIHSFDVAHLCVFINFVQALVRELNYIQVYLNIIFSVTWELNNIINNCAESPYRLGDDWGHYWYFLSIWVFRCF